MTEGVEIKASRITEAAETAVFYAEPEVLKQLAKLGVE